MMVARIRSLPRYNLPFLLQSHLHRPSPVHHFNFVANGHPYKITVNDKVCFIFKFIFNKIYTFTIFLLVKRFA